MRGDVFERNIQRLTRWHRKTDLTPEQLATWFEFVGHIPDEAFRDIVNACIEHEKFMPTPGRVKQLWFEWLKEHPESTAKIDRYHCDECGGLGYIEYWTWDTGNVYAWLCGCARCENWKAVFPSKGPNIPKLMTKQHIREMGGVLEDPMPKTPQRSETVATIEHAVDIALHDMPEAAVSF
jgi:hypothetical protein